MTLKSGINFNYTSFSFEHDNLIFMKQNRINKNTFTFFYQKQCIKKTSFYLSLFISLDWQATWNATQILWLFATINASRLSFSNRNSGSCRCKGIFTWFWTLSSFTVCSTKLLTVFTATSNVWRYVPDARMERVRKTLSNSTSFFVFYKPFYCTFDIKYGQCTRFFPKKYYIYIAKLLLQ